MNPLVHALERIRDANPNNTNSDSAKSMASWTQAVAGCALAEFDTERGQALDAAKDVEKLYDSLMQAKETYRAEAQRLAAELRAAQDRIYVLETAASMATKALGGTVQELEQQLDKMETALKPFADVGYVYLNADQTIGNLQDARRNISWRDLMNAAEAYHG